MDSYAALREAELARGEISPGFSAGRCTGCCLPTSFIYLVQHYPFGVYGMGLSAVCLLYNLGVSRLVLSMKPNTWMRFVSVSLDVCFLTLYNGFEAYTHSFLVPITTATLLIYPSIILLAALRLDRVLIIYATLIIALAMNILYCLCLPHMDIAVTSRLASGDPIGQAYRTGYILLCGVLMLFIPKTVERLLRIQKDLQEANTVNLEKAHTDKLTGLANRRHLDAVLPQLLRQSETNRRECGILYIDLDGFKAVNDTCGHDAGDLVLKEIADRLTATLRDRDLIARVGGDEFVIVATQLETGASLEILADRILAAVRLPPDRDGSPARPGRQRRHKPLPP